MTAAAGLQAALPGPSAEGCNADRRVRNGAVGCQPAMIACCKEAAAIRFARHHGPQPSRTAGHRSPAARP